MARIIVALSATLAAIHNEEDNKEHVENLHRLLVTAAIVCFTTGRSETNKQCYDPVPNFFSSAVDLYFWIVVNSFYRQLKEEEEASQPLGQPDV